jgi:hypothetical protein
VELVAVMPSAADYERVDSGGTREIEEDVSIRDGNRYYLSIIYVVV